MAEESNGSGTEIFHSEHCTLHEMETDLTLLSLLQEACKCSDYKRQTDLLARCVSCDYSNIVYLLSLEQFQRALMCAIDLAIIPAQGGKEEYYSYKKDDFKQYSEKAYYVLSICNQVLHALSQRYMDENINNSVTKISDEGEIEKVTINGDFIFFIPKLSLLIGAHCGCPLWSSSNLEALSLQVFDRLLLCFSCESLDTLFRTQRYSYDTAAGEVKGNKNTLLFATLLHFWKPLSKNVWHQNLFLCHSFHWLILQMKLPNLSDYIEQIMSVALNFVEDHQPVNKVRGISCLHHLIKNTSAEEMRWLSRADVIYEILKNQMYQKEPAVIECLFPCLFDILKVLESPPDLDRHYYVFDALILDTEGENMLLLRKIYIRSLTFLLQQVGIYSVRYLQKLIKITGNYFEVDDGFGGESARPDALKMLESIVRNCWPRIGQHSDAILKLCLNFIADVNCAADTISDVQYGLTAGTIHCLVLLSEVCTEVLPCIKAALKAGMANADCDSHLFDILKQQLEKIDK